MMRFLSPLLMTMLGAFLLERGDGGQPLRRDRRRRYRSRGTAITPQMPFVALRGGVDECPASVATPPDTITGIESASASAAVCGMFGPVSMPSRAMSV